MYDKHLSDVYTIMEQLKRQIAEDDRRIKRSEEAISQMSNLAQRDLQVSLKMCDEKHKSALISCFNLLELFFGEEIENYITNEINEKK